jgi:hypothetical protein
MNVFQFARGQVQFEVRVFLGLLLGGGTHARVRGYQGHVQSWCHHAASAPLSLYISRYHPFICRVPCVECGAALWWRWLCDVVEALAPLVIACAPARVCSRTRVFTRANCLRARSDEASFGAAQSKARRWLPTRESWSLCCRWACARARVCVSVQI